LFCFLFHFQYFHLNEFPVKKLLPIVGGDFNETLMPIDRKSKCKNGTFIQPVASLKTFIKTNNLTDIWRKFNQDKQQFTWRRKDKTQASRIDMITIFTFTFPINWHKSFVKITPNYWYSSPMFL
jgi:exonuclease III